MTTKQLTKEQRVYAKQADSLHSRSLGVFGTLSTRMAQHSPAWCMPRSMEAIAGHFVLQQTAVAQVRLWYGSNGEWLFEHHIAARRTTSQSRKASFLAA